MSISPGQNPSSFKALEATSAILPSQVVTCLLSCIPDACLLPAVLTCFLTLSLLISDQPYFPGSPPFYPAPGPGAPLHPPPLHHQLSDDGDFISKPF